MTTGATVLHDVVILIDCDNTLLDNDHVASDLRSHLEQHVGEMRADRYWQLFEELRLELGYADYLGALQRYRLEHLEEVSLLEMSNYLIEYPFANRLYPGSLDALQRLRSFGPTVVLSDGDVVFQPRKIRRSGIWDEVEGRVLIYVHKEEMLPSVERLYPARHYIMIDDKLRLLTSMKESWRERLTTVFVRQGHYALDPRITTEYPPPDVAVERIGDLVNAELAALIVAARPKGDT